MSVKHTWEPRGLYIQYIGRVTGRELIESSLKLSGHPKFDKIDYVLADWSQATESTVTAEDVRELAAYIEAMAKTNPNVKNVTVMYPDETRQALVALFALFTENFSWQNHAVHSLEEGRAWLAENI